MMEIIRPERSIKKPLKKIRTEFIRRRARGCESEEAEQEEQKEINFSVPYDLMVDMMDFNNKLCREEADFERFHTSFGKYLYKETNSGKQLVIEVENPLMVKQSYTHILKERLKISNGSQDFEELRRQFLEKYNTLITNYIQAVNDPNEKAQKGLEKLRRKAKKTMEHIETRWPFYKLSSFGDKDSLKPISFTYSEQYLQILGYSFLQFFLTFANSNSFPKILQEASVGLLGQTILTGLLNLLDSQKPRTFPKIKDCSVRGINNTSINCTLQPLLVFEPREHGFLLHNYFIAHHISKSRI